VIDIVSGDLSKGKDWAEVWLKSQKHDEVLKELDRLKSESKGKENESNESEEDQYEYAATTGTQMREVFKRASTQLWRDTDYVTNKGLLLIFAIIPLSLADPIDLLLFSRSHQSLSISDPLSSMVSRSG
jgi:ATP-binding cassette subfamily G (WHITE) protein 2 (SNQ2)